MLFAMLGVLLLLMLLMEPTASLPFFATHPPSAPSAQQQLILISGCTGTGKSTFGMEVAISRGILKCISTDTIRQVQRTYDTRSALHRSSFQGTDEPAINWRETCDILQDSIDNVVYDCLGRGISLVLEGVHIVPDRKLVDAWMSKGGIAVGCVLHIPDEEIHRTVISRRGEQTTKGSAAQQLERFTRIRAIHDEMLRLGQLNDWLLIEQKPTMDLRPIDLVNRELTKDSSSRITWEEGKGQNLLSWNPAVRKG